MATKLISTKITPEALRMVRLLRALTGEKQYEVLERILKAEYEKLLSKETRKENKK